MGEKEGEKKVRGSRKRAVKEEKDYDISGKERDSRDFSEERNSSNCL